jgi:hypothetical protein
MASIYPDKTFSPVGSTSLAVTNLGTISLAFKPAFSDSILGKISNALANLL